MLRSSTPRSLSGPHSPRNLGSMKSSESHGSERSHGAHPKRFSFKGIKRFLGGGLRGKHKLQGRREGEEVDADQHMVSSNGAAFDEGGADLDVSSPTPRTLVSILPTGPEKDKDRDKTGTASVSSTETVDGGKKDAGGVQTPRRMSSGRMVIPDDEIGVSGDIKDGYSSDGSRASVYLCTNEECVVERKRLRKQLDDLRHRLQAAEDAKDRLSRELTALRLASQQTDQQPMETPYVSNYDIVVSQKAGDSSGGGPAPPLASQRVQHQRINPDLVIRENDIEIDRIIGVGSFGKVWKGTYQGQVVAIKCIFSEDADVVAEINMMERVSGKPHVLSLVGVYVSNDTGEDAQVALVTPFMSNGSLYDLLVNKKAQQYRASVSMNTIVKIAMDSADGVRHLHGENIIHRDLACRNLLVNEHLEVYVSDFGFARQKEQKSSKGFTKNNMGPVKWEAPESLQKKEYSEKTDAFSFGVCLYEMVTGQEPWANETHAQVAYQVICGNRLPIPLNCDPVMAGIMQQCWETDPRKRPNFEFIYGRLRQRHTMLNIEESEVRSERQLVYQLRQGTTFYKLPYLKGMPHKRQFRISEDLRRLKWCFLPTRNLVQRARDPVRPAFKSMFLSDVQDIRIGMCTANFRRIEGVEKYRSHSAFSIITKDRTIDILCPTPEIMDQWVLGLRFLVERLQSLPTIQPRIEDHWTLMAHLRRGSFLLKFGHSGKPHERYFRVSGNMKMLFWTAGENPIKGVHKSVELTVIKEVRLLRQNPVVAQRANRIAELLSKGVQDLEFGFSLLNSLGQAVINLVAPNREEFLNWTKGLELILQNFQNPEASHVTNNMVKSGEDLPVYDRGDYLEFDASYMPLDGPDHSRLKGVVEEAEDEEPVAPIIQNPDTVSEAGSADDEVEVDDDEVDEDLSTTGPPMAEAESQRSIVNTPTLNQEKSGDSGVSVYTADTSRPTDGGGTVQDDEPWSPSNPINHGTVELHDIQPSIEENVIDPGLPAAAVNLNYADGNALLSLLRGASFTNRPN